jgi:hypothetical protein
MQAPRFQSLESLHCGMYSTVRLNCDLAIGIDVMRHLNRRFTKRHQTTGVAFAVVSTPPWLVQSIDNFVKRVNVVVMQSQMQSISLRQRFLQLDEQCRTDIRSVAHAKVLVVYATISHFGGFIGPTKSPLRWVCTDTCTIHCFYDCLHSSSHHNTQGSKKEGRQARALNRFDSQCIALGAHFDGFHHIIADIALLRWLQRPMILATSIDIPCFFITAITTTTGSGSMKVNFMAFMIGVAETGIANDTGRIRLASTAVPSNVTSFKDITTRTSSTGTGLSMLLQEVDSRSNGLRLLLQQIRPIPDLLFGQILNLSNIRAEHGVAVLLDHIRFATG